MKAVLAIVLLSALVAAAICSASVDFDAAYKESWNMEMTLVVLANSQGNGLLSSSNVNVIRANLPFYPQLRAMLLQAQCKDGVVFANQCYKVVKQDVNFNGADAACKAWGGALASIVNGEENAVIQARVRQLSCGAAWLGGSDGAKEGTWKWLDGKAWGYTNWAPGEPNNYVVSHSVGDEDHLEMYEDGKWNDIAASTVGRSHCYVCKKEIIPMFDKCALNNGGCADQATCEMTASWDVKCTCKSGFSGNGKTCSDVNECLTNNGGCNANAVCTNTVGSRTCACKPGFSGDGFTCTDVNECLTNNGGCDANAVCTNTVGSRTCKCKPGFSGNGLTCADVNECLVNNGGCNANAVCTNTVGSRTCACKQGFSGDGLTCTDVNECLTNNGGCDANAVCTNTFGSRTCKCKSGYSGNGETCSDVNECLVNNGGCDKDAVCTNTIGSRTCACKQGFQGDGNKCAPICDGYLAYDKNCYIVPKQDKTYPEALEACKAWGGLPASIHSETENSLIREEVRKQLCGAAWLGGSDSSKERTWTWVDGSQWKYQKWAPGEPNNYIINGGDEDNLEMYEDGNWNDIAASTKGRAHCYVCKRTYDRNPVPNKCLSNNGGCDANAVCSQSQIDGTVKCTCKSGFSGNGQTCADVNECLTNNGGCDANAVCTNTFGSRTCACKSGFSGDGLTCTDINECLTNNGGCSVNAVCQNTIGSRTCTCKSGFSGDGVTCNDVNECLTNNGGCDANAVCQNTVGDRTCTCKSGFTGNGLTCTDVNECLVNNGGCSANAVCQNTIGSRTCTCKSGFSGDGVTCNDINECLSGNGGCDANAACTNTNGGRVCTCNRGFTGNGLSCTRICDTGVISSRGKCFKVVNNQNLGFEQAKAACQAWGGQLASIANEEENNIIKNRINNCNTWIGGSDNITERTWYWMDGTAWGYTNWAPGEPNDYGIGEDLLEMYGDGKWNDINTSYRPSACYACSKNAY